MFEALGRLVEIAVLARERRNSIIETARSLGREEMCQDLARVAMQFEAVTSAFGDRAEEIRASCD